MAKNNLDKKQLAVVIGVMVVVGLLAGVIGNITGEIIKVQNSYRGALVYTKMDIDNKKFTTDQNVLNMLNKCIYESTEDLSLNTCNQLCNSKSRTCIAGFLINEVDVEDGDHISILPQSCDTPVYEAIRGTNGIGCFCCRS